MNQHRENLLKLIKMMNAIHKESIYDNKARGMTDSESERYIQYERLISIRELTRMFIEELNSEYLQCSDGDEIVRFIEDMAEWLQLAYDFTIEDNASTTGVKSLKVCSQSLSDYKKVYNEAKDSKFAKGGRPIIATISKDCFEFGKRNLPKVQFDNTGMTVNDGELTIINNSERILSTENPENFEEIYKYIRSCGEMMKMIGTSLKSIEERLNKDTNTKLDLTITGGENITSEKLEKIMSKFLKQQVSKLDNINKL